MSTNEQFTRLVARAANQTHHYAYRQFDASAPYASNLAHDTIHTEYTHMKWIIKWREKKTTTNYISWELNTFREIGLHLTSLFRGFNVHTHFAYLGGIKTMNRLRIFVTIICIIWAYAIVTKIIVYKKKKYFGSTCVLLISFEIHPKSKRSLKQSTKEKNNKETSRKKHTHTPHQHQHQQTVLQKERKKESLNICECS